MAHLWCAKSKRLMTLIKKRAQHIESLAARRKLRTKARSWFRRGTDVLCQKALLPKAGFVKRRVPKFLDFFWQKRLLTHQSHFRGSSPTLFFYQLDASRALAWGSLCEIGAPQVRDCCGVPIVRVPDEKSMALTKGQIDCFLRSDFFRAASHFFCPV